MMPAPGAQVSRAHRKKLNDPVGLLVMDTAGPQLLPDEGYCIKSDKGCPPPDIGKENSRIVRRTFGFRS